MVPLFMLFESFRIFHYDIQNVTLKEHNELHLHTQMLRVMYGSYARKLSFFSKRGMSMKDRGPIFYRFVIYFRSTRGGGIFFAS